MFDFNIFISNLGYTPTKIYPKYVYFTGKEHEFAVEKEFETCLFRIKKPIKNTDFDHTIKISINGNALMDFVIDDDTYKYFPAWLSTWRYAPVVPLDYKQYGILDVSDNKIKSIKFDQDVDCVLINDSELESIDPERKNRWRKFT